jgi:coenzyme F420-0:L-glutamate ligase / coenzyme F420-1:gamma-L-glutamate ligase
MRTLTFSAIPDFPFIEPGDDLSDTIVNTSKNCGIQIIDCDIFVLAQKIVSKSEGRLIQLSSVLPSKKAIEMGKKADKDPRFVELILRESTEVLRVRRNTIIVQHKQGFICANAGIDHSNVKGKTGEPEDWVLLLPENPDESANRIRVEIKRKTKKNVGILIIDSHGRAWRNGVVGISIGFAGIPGLVDLRGKPDLFGYNLRITQVAAADELAAGASLLMGQANERTPVIHVRGFPYPLRESLFSELVRDKKMDLFR